MERCVEDDHNMETLLSRCMARTSCTPPVYSKPLTSCELTPHSDFVQVEYRCIPGYFLEITCSRISVFEKCSFNVIIIVDRQPKKQINKITTSSINNKLECGPMSNVMAALPNIGGALCESSVIHSLYHVAKFG